MRLSAKVEYAAIAVLELSRTYGTGEPIQIRKIADSHDIPSRFLVQILLQLKGAGLVSSTRGASGGYQLVRNPDQVTLWDVLQIIEGADDGFCGNSAGSSNVATVLANAWQASFDELKRKLQATTFATLVERSRNQEDMYYI